MTSREKLAEEYAGIVFRAGTPSFDEEKKTFLAGYSACEKLKDARIQKLEAVVEAARNIYIGHELRREYRADIAEALAELDGVE